MGLSGKFCHHFPVHGAAHPDHLPGRKATVEVQPVLWLWGCLYYLLSFPDKHRNDAQPDPGDRHPAAFLQLRGVFAVGLHHPVVYFYKAGCLQVAIALKQKIPPLSAWGFFILSTYQPFNLSTFISGIDSRSPRESGQLGLTSSPLSPQQSSRPSAPAPPNTSQASSWLC